MAWWRSRLTALLAAVLVAMASQCAQAQQAVVESYQQNDGLTSLPVVSLTQTPNGMLWIGTENGLFRFDGFRIRRINLPAAAGTDVRAMVAHGRGGLWVATHLGLYFAPSLVGDLQWSPVLGPGAAPLSIEDDRRLDLTAQGDLVAMDGDGRLWSISATQPLVAHPLQLPAYPTYAGAEDGTSVNASGPVRVAGDALWFGCGTGLCTWRGGQLRQWGTEQGLPKRAWGSMVLAHDGSLWARAPDRLARLAPGTARFDTIAAPATAGWTGSIALAVDARGAILTSSKAGIARWDGQRWQQWGHEDGMPETAVRVLMFSSDGGLWFGTSGRGLHHWVGYGAVDQWTPASGLPSPVVFSILRDGKGRLWAATTRGLAWLDPAQGRFHPLLGLSNPQAPVISLATDAEGSVWWVQDGWLLRVRAGESTAQQVLRAPTLMQTVQGGDHAVYLTSNGGLDLLVRSGTSWQRRPLAHKLLENVTEIANDGERDWFFNGQLSRLDQGTLKPLRDPQGTALKGISTGTATGPGQFWVNDSSGAARYVVHGDQATLEHRYDSAGFNQAKGYFLRAGPEGRLWYGTGQGVFILDQGRWQLLDHSNGLLWNDIDDNGFWMDPDGTVWIGTSAGITQVHPGWQSAPPASLRLNELQFGTQLMGAVPQVQIPWADRSLRVGVGTPAISQGRALRVEYRQHDQGPWLSVEGDALQIESLSSGAHTLELRAVAKGGVGQAGPPLRIDFTVAPPWWLSGPAWAAYAMGLLALLLASNMLASRRALQVRLKLERAIADRTFLLAVSRENLRKLGEHNARVIEAERTHVARELHDEMGQQLAALRMEASVLQASARAGQTLAPEQFNLLFDRLGLLVHSVRALVKQLRPPALDGGIVAAIEWLADEFSTTTGIACQLDLDAAAQDLPQDSAIMVFRIAQESLTNVRRHAQASRVDIQLKRGSGDSCTLLVRDNGVGLAPKRGHGGHGLLGMRERARLLGGELTISSQPGAGTTVRFHVDEHTRQRHEPGALDIATQK